MVRQGLVVVGVVVVAVSACGVEAQGPIESSQISSGLNPKIELFNPQDRDCRMVDVNRHRARSAPQSRDGL